MCELENPCPFFGHGGGGQESGETLSGAADIGGRKKGGNMEERKQGVGKEKKRNERKEGRREEEKKGRKKE